MNGSTDRSLNAGTIAGALAIILVWAAGQLGVSMPAEVAAALSFLVSVAVTYYTRPAPPA